MILGGSTGGGLGRSEVRREVLLCDVDGADEVVLSVVEGVSGDEVSEGSEDSVGVGLAEVFPDGVD
ncbi:hypothetical protein, partial [Amycolatopsis sp. H20-H5]|uniref:hypothetical protein n=1 Tax=Amycolatopsis sp. H20-H5 TaxID=3046309 RepID=UPI002DBAFD64